MRGCIASSQRHPLNLYAFAWVVVLLVREFMTTRYADVLPPRNGTHLKMINR
jgi:hypothetical protein